MDITRQPGLNQARVHGYSEEFAPLLDANPSYNIEATDENIPETTLQQFNRFMKNLFVNILGYCFLSAAERIRARTDRRLDNFNSPEDLDINHSDATCRENSPPAYTVDDQSPYSTAPTTALTGNNTSHEDLNRNPGEEMCTENDSPPAYTVDDQSPYSTAPTTALTGNNTSHESPRTNFSMRTDDRENTPSPSVHPNTPLSPDTDDLPPYTVDDQNPNYTAFFANTSVNHGYSYINT